MEIVKRQIPTRQKQTKIAKKESRKRKPAKQKQLTPGRWFEKLVAVQARLRAPNGCPWDREQTHQTLRTYVIEEAYDLKQKQLTPGRWFEKLVAVQARLRAPNGCPWDREQTHQTLRTYVIEEA